MTTQSQHQTVNRQHIHSTITHRVNDNTAAAPTHIVNQQHIHINTDYWKSTTHSQQFIVRKSFFSLLLNVRQSSFQTLLKTSSRDFARHTCMKWNTGKKIIQQHTAYYSSTNTLQVNIAFPSPLHIVKLCCVCRLCWMKPHNTFTHWLRTVNLHLQEDKRMTNLLSLYLGTGKKRSAPSSGCLDQLEGREWWKFQCQSLQISGTAARV